MNNIYVYFFCLNLLEYIVLFALNFDILVLVKLDIYLRNVDTFVSLKTYSWPARAVNEIEIKKKLIELKWAILFQLESSAFQCRDIYMWPWKLSQFT